MEFFQNLLSLPLAEQVSNLHGLLATLCILGFGALFVIIPVYSKYGPENLQKPLVYILGIQTLFVGAVSTAGIVAYVAYRTAGGAREFLLSSPQTTWLHSIAFEYKEYLCGIAPWLLLAVAFFIALRLGSALHKNKAVLNLILIAAITSAVLVFITSTLAVLIAKIAPLEKFAVGGNLFQAGGNLVIGIAILTVIVLGGLFWLLTKKISAQAKESGNYNSLTAIIYGSAVGLTVMWILDVAQAANAGFKQAIMFIPSVGQYSGVMILSLITVIVASLIIWLAALKIKKPWSIRAAFWVFVVSAWVMAIAFFPPFYHMFIK
ncbi:MAG: hypothetical protein ACYDHZ_07705 [Dehalococcoidia bacterium]